jgi:hypothetical protein
VTSRAFDRISTTSASMCPAASATRDIIRSGPGREPEPRRHVTHLDPGHPQPVTTGREQDLVPGVTQRPGQRNQREDVPDQRCADHENTHQHTLGGYEGDMIVPILRSFVLDSTDARRLAEFYRRLLDLDYREGDEPPPAGSDDPRGRDWLVLLARDGAYRLAFQQTKGVRPTSWPSDEIPQQAHLDTSVPSVDDLNRQHSRILSLGATLRFDRSDDPEEPLRAYADPDGHIFCVFVA